MHKLSSKPYPLRDHSKTTRFTVPVLVPRPAESRTELNDNGKPRRHYRGSVRATLNNTCEVCGELVQEPGDMYCAGDKCPEDRGSDLLFDVVDGEDGEDE